MFVLLRLRNLLLEPKSEWIAIKEEALTNLQIYFKFLIWIAALPPVGYLLSFAQFENYLLNVRAAIVSYVIVLISADVSASILNMLSPNFDAAKDLNRALKLIAFGISPIMVASIWTFIPVLGTLIWLVGAVYSAYLFYLGLPVLLGAAESKLVSFVVTTVVIFIAIYVILILIAGFVFNVNLVWFL